MTAHCNLWNRTCENPYELQQGLNGDEEGVEGQQSDGIYGLNMQLIFRFEITQSLL